MKIFFLSLLGALLAQIVVTIVAFQQLTWWQAILVSIVFFSILVRLMKWLAVILFRRFMKRTEETLKKHINLRLFHQAQVQVHSIQPASMPRHIAYILDNPELSDDERTSMEAEYADLAWQAFDMTIVPEYEKDDDEPRRWQPGQLSLAPRDALVPSSPWDQARQEAPQLFPLHELSILVDGTPRPLKDALLVEGVEGPQRLLFIAGIPRSVSQLKCVYYTTSFGVIDLYV